MENDTEVPIGLNETLSDIRAELAGLHAQCKFMNDVNDRLHTENERLRRSEARTALPPAVRELIKLADDWRSRTAQDADPGRLCADVVEDVMMILERQGIEAFSAEEGAEFDRRQHRAVGTTSTEDAALDGRVAELRRPGYRDEERVVRFAEVVVYRVASADN